MNVLSSQSLFHRDGRATADRHEAYDAFKQFGSVGYSYEDRIVLLTRIHSSLVCRDYVPLVNLIAVAFQIRDDYMNLQSSEVRTSFLTIKSIECPISSSPVFWQQRILRGFDRGKVFLPGCPFHTSRRIKSSSHQ